MTAKPPWISSAPAFSAGTDAAGAEDRTSMPPVQYLLLDRRPASATVSFQQLDNPALPNCRCSVRPSVCPELNVRKMATSIDDCLDAVNIGRRVKRNAQDAVAISLPPMTVPSARMTMFWLKWDSRSQTSNTDEPWTVT